MTQPSLNGSYVERTREGVLKWMESVRDRSEGWGRWKYTAGMQRPHALVSTRQALWILDLFGVLTSVSAKEKAEAVAFLQSSQDTDGFFKDSLVGEKDLSAGHSYVMQDLWVQMDATVALQLLGAKPLHASPKKVHCDLTGEDGMAWVRSLDWTNPWLEGVIRYARDMCINWDSVWVLRQLDKQLKGEYRHADIVRAAQRLAECLLRDYRKPDGGFAFAADHCLLIHQGVKLSPPLPVSDMVGTRMCLECLSYADEWSDDAR